MTEKKRWEKPQRVGDMTSDALRGLVERAGGKLRLFARLRRREATLETSDGTLVAMAYLTAVEGRRVGVTRERYLELCRIAWDQSADDDGEPLVKTE